MIFDWSGLPRENGATDFNDSARLAGIITTFGFPTENKIELEKYISYPLLGKFYYVRHPLESKYDFSRDQAICLMAGLHTQWLDDYVSKEYVDGKDIFSPSQNGHVKRCQGNKANWFENLWLWFDVLWSCYINPLAEPNQLICMLMVADKKYLKFWLDHNKKWQKSIRDYWYMNAGAWRGEKELAEHIIASLSYVKDYYYDYIR